MRRSGNISGGPQATTFAPLFKPYKSNMGKCTCTYTQTMKENNAHMIFDFHFIFLLKQINSHPSFSINLGSGHSFADYLSFAILSM